MASSLSYLCEYSQVLSNPIYSLNWPGPGGNICHCTYKKRKMKQVWKWNCSHSTCTETRLLLRYHRRPADVFKYRGKDIQLLIVSLLVFFLHSDSSLNNETASRVCSLKQTAVQLLWGFTGLLLYRTSRCLSFWLHPAALIKHETFSYQITALQHVSIHSTKNS